MMTPTSGFSRLRVFKTSRPPWSGRLISTSAKSNTCSSNFFKPSSAVAAVTAWWPSSAKSCSRLSRISFSSSMIRMAPLRDMDGPPEGRELQTEGTPLADGAFDADLPAVLAHDAVGDGEAEARAAAGGLGGEEGIEDLREVIGRDTHAVVADLDAHGRVFAFSCERQLAAVGHGVAGVHDEVHENLLQPPVVAVDARKPADKLRVQSDLRGAQHGFDQCQGLANDAVQIHFRILAAAHARELEQAVDNLGSPKRLLDDAIKSFRARVVGRDLPHQHLRLRSDHGERGVDFVSDARGKQPDRRELFGLDELVFQLDALREVVQDHEASDDAALFSDQRRERQVDNPLAA